MIKRRSAIIETEVNYFIKKYSEDVTGIQNASDLNKRWEDVITKVDEGYTWLFTGNPEIESNAKKAADAFAKSAPQLQAEGVKPEEIVTAAKFGEQLNEKTATSSVKDNFKYRLEFVSKWNKSSDDEKVNMLKEAGLLEEKFLKKLADNNFYSVRIPQTLHKTAAVKLNLSPASEGELIKATAFLDSYVIKKEALIKKAADSDGTDADELARMETGRRTVRDIGEAAAASRIGASGLKKTTEEALKAAGFALNAITDEQKTVLKALDAATDISKMTPDAVGDLIEILKGGGNIKVNLLEVMKSGKLGDVDVPHLKSPSVAAKLEKSLAAPGTLSKLWTAIKGNPALSALKQAIPGAGLFKWFGKIFKILPFVTLFIWGAYYLGHAVKAWWNAGSEIQKLNLGISFWGGLVDTSSIESKVSENKDNPEVLASLGYISNYYRMFYESIVRLIVEGVGGAILPYVIGGIVSLFTSPSGPGAIVAGILGVIGGVVALEYIATALSSWLGDDYLQIVDRIKNIAYENIARLKPLVQTIEGGDVTAVPDVGGTGEEGGVGETTVPTIREQVPSTTPEGRKVPWAGRAGEGERTIGLQEKGRRLDPVIYGPQGWQEAREAISISKKKPKLTPEERRLIRQERKALRKERREERKADRRSRRASLNDLNELVKLANRFDAEGRFDLSDEIDNILNAYLIDG